jgi:hypothetical protein
LVFRETWYVHIKCRDERAKFLFRFFLAFTNIVLVVEAYALMRRIEFAHNFGQSGQLVKMFRNLPFRSHKGAKSKRQRTSPKPLTVPEPKHAPFSSRAATIVHGGRAAVSRGAGDSRKYQAHPEAEAQEKISWPVRPKP